MNLPPLPERVKNDAGETMCIVRYMVETPAGWLGAWDEGAFASYATAAVKAERADAERYRWIKSRKGLDLRTEHDHCVWTRIDGSKFCATHYLAEGGTQHAPAESLDATVDAAMLAAAIRARVE